MIQGLQNQTLHIQPNTVLKEKKHTTLMQVILSSLSEKDETASVQTSAPFQAHLKYFSKYFTLVQALCPPLDKAKGFATHLRNNLLERKPFYRLY